MTARAALLLLLALWAAGCNTTMYQARFNQPRYRHRIDRGAPFLKVHTHDGEVYVLAHWKLDEKRQRVAGRGLHYDVDREVKARGALVVPYRDIVLLETNRPEKVRTHNQFAAMVMMTTVTVGLAGYCIAYPGVCF